MSALGARQHGPSTGSHRSENGAHRLHVALLVGFLLVLAWSGYRPRDRFTWLLEVLPAVVGVGVLVVTYRRFRFTSLAYGLVALHTLVLLVGGH